MALYYNTLRRSLIEPQQLLIIGTTFPLSKNKESKRYRIKLGSSKLAKIAFEGGRGAYNPHISWWATLTHPVFPP